MDRTARSGWGQRLWVCIVVSGVVLGGSDPDRGVSAGEIVLPGPWYDVNKEHLADETTGGPTWDYNYYTDLDGNWNISGYTAGEPWFEELPEDTNHNYINDENNWPPDVHAAKDRSSGTASAANMVLYRLGPGYNPYANWAYDWGVVGTFTNPWGSDRAGTYMWDDPVLPHWALEMDGHEWTVQAQGSWNYNWGAPMDYVHACLQESAPVSLGYEYDGYRRFLTVYGLDRDAGTLRATDPRHDTPGEPLPTFNYTVSGEDVTLSGPLGGPVDYLCGFDLVGWWVGGAGQWTEASQWANRHVPTTAQAVYLTHPHLIDITCFGAAEAEAVYFDNPGFNNRIVLGTGASMAVTRDVVLGMTARGRIEHHDGTLTIGADLTLGRDGGSQGSYELNGGTLHAANTYVGGVGIGQFVHNNGRHEVDGMLSLGHGSGGDGTYTLKGAIATSELHAPIEIVGEYGAGVFEQSGGANYVGDCLTIGRHATGTYRMTGPGELVVASDLVIADEAGGGFEQSGGTVQALRYLTVGADAGGYYTLTGGDLIAANMYVGARANASLNQSGGTAEVLGELVLAETSAVRSVYGMTGGRLEADRLVVGHKGKAEVYHSAGTVEVSDELVVGDDTFVGGFYNLTGGSLNVEHLVVGHEGRGEMTVEGTSSPVLRIGVDGRIGNRGGGSATLRLKAGGTLELDGLLHIGRTTGLDPGEAAPNSILEMDGGTIAACQPAWRVMVHGSQASLIGPGAYDTEVVYESDPLYGAADDQCLGVTFEPDVLIRGARFHVDPGLTTYNTGGAERAVTLWNGTLDGSAFWVQWGDPADPATNVGYRTGGGAPWPHLGVPYDSAEVTGNSHVSKDRIEKRMYLWQFRDGMVRNVSKIDTDGVPSIDPGEGVVVGESADVAGDFDLAVGGKAVDPVHQNPHIAALHQRGLTGEGVRIGQIEKAVPYTFHGPFYDWEDTAASSLRVALYDPAGKGHSYHASAVAATMVGYDPLGLEVTGQSQFPEAAERYGDGFGFTGVAPGATLVSCAETCSYDSPGLKHLASPGSSTPVKVINQSMDLPIEPATGDHALSKLVDHWTSTRWLHVENVGGRLANAVGPDGIIFCLAAGNDGDSPSSLSVPTGSYNAIVVGNAEFDHPAYGSDNPAHPTHFEPEAARVATKSSRGPTLDGRVGVDLLAQGTGNFTTFDMTLEEEENGDKFITPDPDYHVDGSRGLYSTYLRTGDTTAKARSGTSLAAPVVAGMAALMVEQARLMNRPIAESPLVTKSILMTTADKLTGWEKGAPGILDDGIVPLDYNQGAGLLDPEGAIDLLTADRHHHGPDPVPSRGWAWDVLFREDLPPEPVSGPRGHIYRLELEQGEVLTATLNWFRHVDRFEFSGGADYVAMPVTDLNLALYYVDGPAPIRVDCSLSPIENVEHLYVDAEIATGLYELCVWADNFPPEWHSEEYALSWEVVPEPATLALLAIGGLGLVLRRRRRHAA